MHFLGNDPVRAGGLSAWTGKVLSLFRIVAGLMLMQHGLQKIFGFPAEAPGPFHLASQMGIGGVLEVAGGALIVLGLFTRPAAFILSGMMAVAYVQMHWRLGAASPYPLVNEGELAVMYCWFFFYLVFAGPGEWAMDNLPGRRRRRY